MLRQMRRKGARRCPWIDALVNTLVITRVRAAQSGTKCSAGADASLVSPAAT